MRISDWSSDVCSSDLQPRLARAFEPLRLGAPAAFAEQREHFGEVHRPPIDIALDMTAPQPADERQIVMRLDPLGGRLHVERAREPDDRRADRGVQDRKSTRMTPVTNAHLVRRLMLEKKK